MAITTNQSLADALAVSRKLHYTYTTRSTGIGDLRSWCSMWTSTGYPNAVGSAPGGGLDGSVITSSTTGAMPYQNASGGTQKYLGAFAANGNTGSALIGGKVILFDRLWANTITATSTSTQTVSSFPGLPARDSNGSTNGHGILAWLEIYANTTNASPSTCTITYTNSAGTGSRTATTSVIGGTSVGVVIPFQLAAGDLGVRSVEDITLSLSLGGSASVGITLMRRIAEVELTMPFATCTKNAYDLGLPRLWDNSALTIGYYGNNQPATPSGYIHLIEA